MAIHFEEDDSGGKQGNIPGKLHVDLRSGTFIRRMEELELVGYRNIG